MQEKKEKCTFAIRLLSISINSPVPDLVPIYYQLVSGGIVVLFRTGGGCRIRNHLVPRTDTGALLVDQNWDLPGAGSKGEAQDPRITPLLYMF